MKEQIAFDPQAAINVLPNPPQDRRNRLGDFRIPPEDRYTYTTPNLSDNTTPDANPASTTSFPIKAARPNGVA